MTATSVASSLADKIKNYRVIRDEITYNSWGTAYLGQPVPSPEGFEVDFEVGQVILVDDGEVNNCDAHLSFNSNISVRDLTNIVAEVTLGYDESPQRPNCIPTSSRPFYFYYIGTRKQLSVVDKIE